MNDAFKFGPDQQRAHDFDQRMRARLGSSLKYIIDQTRDTIPLNHAALDDFFKRLATGPVPALTFGAYYELVFAIDDDRLDLAQALFSEIAAAQNRPAGLHVYDLGDPTIDPAAQRYVRLIDTDPNISFTVFPPPSDVANQCRQRMAAGLQLLKAGAPSLADEISALLGEIVIAVGPDDPKAMTFDGASSFMLWGSILLNAKEHKTPFAVAQALAHESGHNLLFGFCTDGSLIENDDAPIYASPFRTDPRPMDGIVHAAYVAARVHLAAAQLLHADVLDEVERAEAQASLDVHARAFAQGIDVIDRHARLTERGHAIMAGARDYMKHSS